MQPIEIALFGAVFALATGLIGYILWLRARTRAGGRAAAGSQLAVGSRARSRAGSAAPGLVCPACQREYAAGLQFCPHDARELVPVSDPAARAAAPGTTCPSCRRSFDAMKRFCPFDGDELVPLTLAVGSAGVPAAMAAGGIGIDIGIQMMGKICPHCSRRYESDATFCGRDGAALVSVN
jgi:predicted amidophosphoribosyltransferase